MAVGKRRRRKPSTSSRQGETPPAVPKDTACAAASQQAQHFPAWRALDGPLTASRHSRWDYVVMEALAYQDPDEAPFEEDDLSTLDIVPHPVPLKGHFGCGPMFLAKCIVLKYSLPWIQG